MFTIISKIWCEMGYPETDAYQSDYTAEWVRCSQGLRYKQGVFCAEGGGMGWDSRGGQSIGMCLLCEQTIVWLGFKVSMCVRECMLCARQSNILHSHGWPGLAKLNSHGNQMQSGSFNLNSTSQPGTDLNFFVKRKLFNPEILNPCFCENTKSV